MKFIIPYLYSCRFYRYIDHRLVVILADDFHIKVEWNKIVQVFWLWDLFMEDDWRNYSL